MRSPPLDQRPPDGAAAELRDEEPAVAAGVLERMPGKGDQEIAEALPDVRLVQFAPERLVRLDVGHEADGEPEPLDATDIVLPRRAPTPVAGDDVLERAVGRERERQPARDAGPAHEVVDRPRRL